MDTLIRQNTRHSIYLLPGMRVYFRNLLYLLVLSVSLFSCRGFEKIRKSSDVNYKLTKANEYYEKKDYSHAHMLYKELMPIMKSTRNYEALYYKYAYTLYYLKDYVEASYHFKNFSEYFPLSKDAEECEYMSAFCLYKYAPKQELDQTNTMKSLEALKTFVVKYPSSTRLADANKLIDESKDKLETKQADAAKLYYNINQFKAATVTYKSVMRNYPESRKADQYLYMIMKANYKYAKASVPAKQEERYATALSAYRELKDTYPQSAYLADAEKLYTETDNNVKKIRNEHK
jgi:outer membrane protein assembly factor BamD